MVHTRTNESRYMYIVRHAKHRIFSWGATVELVSNAIEAFRVEDGFAFGLLHSRIHEVWAVATGTQVREKKSGLRYTPTTCFETFALPERTTDQRGSREIAPNSR